MTTAHLTPRTDTEIAAAILQVAEQHPAGAGLDGRDAVLAFLGAKIIESEIERGRALAAEAEATEWAARRAEVDAALHRAVHRSNRRRAAARRITGVIVALAVTALVVAAVWVVTGTVLATGATIGG